MASSGRHRQDARDGMTPIRGVLLGAPGSGKGTQAAVLSGKLGVPAISTGEMLRAAVAAQTSLGHRVEEILNSGRLVDDETMAEVVKSRLAEADAQNGFLLDGYPRNYEQAETLAKILRELETELDLVWFVDVPEEELMRRALARKREDDKEEVIQKRLELYRDVTDPLVDYYGSLGLVRPVDGAQPIELVTEAMMAALESEAGADVAVEAGPAEAVDA